MGAGLCGTSQDPQNQGSVLDRVISQASNKDDCLLYKLANYKNSGELIEAYNIGGQAEVEKLIKEQFGVLMYADGKGEVIKRAEYLRWKFRDQAQVVLPIEASLSIYDPLAKWEDHEACWQMQYRGSLGETLLHVLIICDSKIHTKLARTLLKCFPKLALDIVEGEEYLGASALHLAIAYNNNELVEDLVDAGANINQRAVGSFFLPKDQQRAKPLKTTDYEGLAYLGEYPLSWAACCSNESVYNLLLDVGADPDSQDSFGNMILHMVVVCDKLDMFGYALRHPKVPASNGIINNEGLTPLTLACKLGRADVFKEMLELSAKEFWRYSNITCSAYPLNALDTLLPDGRTNWNSAIFIILNGTKEEHLDMLDGGIIQRLLEEKWKTFARNQFLKRLVIFFLHIFCLSGSVYLRPDDRNKPLLGGTSVQDVVRYCFEIGTILGVLCYLCFQQGDEIRNQGLISFLKQLPHDPAKFIFLISNLLILACIPYRVAGDTDTEEAILVFAVPSSWFLLMFFAGAIRLTGPFVTMIYSMITGDMLTFGIIYSVFLFGFSQSFFFLYKGSKNVSSSLFTSYPSTWMALFQVTMGDYNYNDLSLTAYPAISKMVFTIFMVLVPILLLNMLIAMMGNTYAHVIEQSEKEWMKQWAKIVVALERAVNQEDCHRYLQEYSIKLGPGDDPSTEQRGVLVIKSKSKTRAKQRKGALCNWKRVGKVTIRELHKRGMTGEQLRRLMWGRSSISTPVKPAPIKLGHVTSISGVADITVPETTGNTVGTGGGGLLAALDVMAFTNDLEFSSENQTSTSFKTQPQPSEVSCVESDSNSDPLYNDPLRQLNEELNKTREEILTLARVAANNDGIEEIPPQICQYGWINNYNFFGNTFAQNQKVEDPVQQPTFQSTPNHSDSDGLGDGLLLGSNRRLKRTRSANIKRKFSGSSTNEKNLLEPEDSSSTNSEDFSCLTENYINKNIKVNANFSENSLRSNRSSANLVVKKFGRRSGLKSSTNRIAPADLSPVGNVSKYSETLCNSYCITSSSDVLYQWSIKGITNMNTLLGLENEDSM
ncbi:conserved hypothetical protein [Pediculus humanus corporis]|uniref:Ion transport domain-containing protein n=1 Tax=Pediculus humanus subsp. corporis TaxID=121224 RepID=E0W1R2_PEDHC|nr:uncharacterized protein Phum_PHUM581890 [Pediculus humanus corporis]EEB19644.1 conserved hypothetical protein [Pediculus humanus corporis]